MQEESFGFLSKAQLVRLRLRAVRAGVWFRVLTMIDRVLVDLTIRVAGSVRSISLAENIFSVVSKLKGHLASKIERAITKIGYPMARRLSIFAQKWGNECAKRWATSVVFARYLTVMNLYGKPESPKRGRAIV